MSGQTGAINFSELNGAIDPVSAVAAKAATNKWNSVAKPIGALGELEDLIVRIAAITGTSNVDIGKRVVIPMCADNGIVEEGVTQSEQEVTALIAENMAKGVSSVCVMAKTAGIDVVPVDVGIYRSVANPNLVDMNVMRSTNNFAKGPAMTVEQACAGIQAGIDIAARASKQGYNLIVTGEMGIGNTSTSSALAAVLLGLDVEQVTGKGSGLSSAGLQRKLAAIKRGIQINNPNSADPLDCLAKVGGLDIAGMVGIYLGGALCHVPVLIDGLISAIAALIAARLCPACKDYMIATHVSAEPAAIMILDELGLHAPISAGLRLGEGTGAVCLIPLLDMALALYNGTSFEDTGMDAYEVDLK